LRPRFGLSLKTAPAAEPVTLVQAKLHLRVDGADDDALINTLIASSRRYVENVTDRALINQTWEMFMDRFSSHHGHHGHHGHGNSEPWWDGVREGAISNLHGHPQRHVEITKSPLSSVVQISTFDTDDTETVFAAANYIVDTASARGRVVLRDGVVWPTALRPANAIKIEFVAGYGTAGTDVPDDILVAMKELIAHWYENRSAVCESKHATVPLTVSEILFPYKYIEV